MTFKTEQAPQKQKTYYENVAQKHGDAASERARLDNRYIKAHFPESHGRVIVEKFADKIHLRESLADEGTLSKMSPEQLEAEADSILGESPLESPAFLTISDDILRQMTNPDVEASVADLLDEYSDLIERRAALLNSDSPVSDEQADHIMTEAASLTEQAKEIEDEIMETLSFQDPFATEAELGLKSKHDIRKEMANRVTRQLEVSYDDNGDNDYDVPVRIHSTLR